MAEIRAGDVRAVPLNGHCWQVQTRRVAKSDGPRRKRGEARWVGVELYPATMEAAALAVFERAVKGPDAEGIAGLVEEVRLARDRICACVREAEVGR